jgi:hypothetical protein
MAEALSTRARCSAVGSYSAGIFPFRVAQLRDARARGGKLRGNMRSRLVNMSRSRKIHTFKVASVEPATN